MGFMTRRKQRLMAEEAARLKKIQEEKAFEAKMKINRSIGQMRRGIQRIERSKQKFIEQGRNAVRTNNEQSKVGARNGLRVCLTQQKVLETMLSTVLVAQEYISMKDTMKNFTNITAVITDQLKDVISVDKLRETTLNCEKAIGQNTSSFEILNEYLNELNGSFEDFADMADDNLSDKDIDKLFVTGLSNELSEEEKITTGQDRDLESLEKKINEF